MEIHSSVTPDNQELTLTLMGKFDYTCQQSFQTAYESVIPKPSSFVVNALEVPSIDSSALGMLLLLRNYAGGDDSKVSIIKTQADVFKLLHTCNFDELFEISPL